MSATGDVRADLAAKLNADGLAATTDPRAVPPFVLLGVPALPASAGVGGWTADLPVWVVSPPPDSDDGLAWRLDTVEAVYAVAGWAPAVPTTWGDRDAPAYLLTYRLPVTDPTC